MGLSETQIMDREQFERTRLLFGDAGMERLYAAKVAIFGIGGVGGYVAEALARCGVGFLVLDCLPSDRLAEMGWRGARRCPRARHVRG